MRAILFSIAAGTLLTVFALCLADRLAADCGDYRSVPLCQPGQR